MEKKQFGRNQIISISGYGIPFFAVYVLCWFPLEAPRVSGPELLSFVQLYVPVAMGTILFVAGAIKSVTELTKPKS